MSLATTKIRVAHLISHPIQYFAPLYRRLSERPEIDLTVYFFSVATLDHHVDQGFGRAVTWDIPLLGGYHHKLVGNAATRPLYKKPDWRPNWGILRDLVRERYDVIWLHGYANGTAWLAAALARVLGIPVLLRDDQTLLTPRSRKSRFLKKLILPLLFRNVRGMYVGEANRRYFEHFGSKRNYRVAHSVDNDFFAERFRELAPSACALRERFGISDTSPVVLFGGKFVDKKKPLLLLEAFEQVRRDLKCHLLLVGDGPLRPQIEEQVKQRSIPDVHFAGFLNQTEIPAAYTAADLLVLPSAYLETWGLVVNEAMNFRLPIIVSDRVGCAADLIEEGRNGFIFPSGDAGSLAAVIRKLVESSELRRDFGRRSAELIEGFSIDAVTTQLVQACVSAATQNKSVKPKFQDLRSPVAK